MTEIRRLTRLPRELAEAIEPVLAEARGSGLRVALVGGVVRDLLRGEPGGRDVDLLVEGDAGALALRAFRGSPDTRVKVHRRFGTATVERDGGVRVDLASSRGERYPRPGALPVVEPATLEEDLARRDFTVNAMAWDPLAGRLLDPLGGARDLADRRLRVLHARSFEDDPTRILRAIRYANRLGLTIEPGTRRHLRRAAGAGALATVSGDRLRRELVKLLSEPHWAAALRRAGELGVLAALEPEWRVSARLTTALRRAEALADRSATAGRHGERDWMAALLTAASELRGPARRRLADRLALAGAERRAFDRWEERDLAEARGGTREEAIARAAVAPPGAGRRLLERRVTAPAAVSLRGADLIAAGVPAGPAVGRALRETRRAIEEGRIGPADELRFAVRAARRAEP